METVTLVPLEEVSDEALMALMNHPKVGRFLPLLQGKFDLEMCHRFRATKAEMWSTHGYGPQGVLINGRFAGWGGVQPEGDDVDFALILHPEFWGYGKQMFETLKAHLFADGQLPSITALFPPERANRNAIRRLGFVEDGSVTIEGSPFIRFRLDNPQYEGAPRAT